MYHAACKVEFQPFKRLYSQLQKKHGTRADDILCKTEYWSQSYRRFSSQKPYNTNVSDVPRSLQSWISTIQTVVLTADVFQLFIKKLFIKKNCWESKCWGVTEPRLEKESSRAGASDQKGGNCAQLKWHNREKHVRFGMLLLLFPLGTAFCMWQPGSMVPPLLINTSTSLLQLCNLWVLTCLVV